MPDKYRVAKLAEIPSPTATAPQWYEWKPIRHHLGIGAFGVNAGIAHNAGDWVVEEHTELQENAAGHEELYFVVQGHARFTIDGEEIDAPAGTLVFVADPGTRRAAKASVPETTVLHVGARRGEAFRISRWERKYWDD